jgi:hypothetical protein
MKKNNLETLLTNIFMKTGWISVHRKLLDTGLSRKPPYFSVWMHILLMANHKEHRFIWNNEEVTLLPGQLLTGLDALSKKSGVPRSTVRRILTFLENEKQIETQITNKFRIITILNWQKYQKPETQNETPTKPDKNPKGIQPEANNNEHNEKNYNNDNNTDVEIYLSNYLLGFNSVNNPTGLAKSILKKYGVATVEKAMDNSACISVPKLYECCEYYLDKKNNPKDYL